MRYRLLALMFAAGLLSACAGGSKMETRTYLLRDAQAQEVDGQAQLWMATTSDDRFVCALSNVQFTVGAETVGTSAVVTTNFWEGYPSQTARKVVLVVSSEERRAKWEAIKASFYQPRDIEPRAVTQAK